MESYPEYSLSRVTDSTEIEKEICKYNIYNFIKGKRRMGVSVK